MERYLTDEEGHRTAVVLPIDEYELLSHLLDDNISGSPSPEDLRDRVLDLNRNLAGRLRAGDAPERTLECLEKTISNKLKVASPRYLERYENET